MTDEEYLINARFLVEQLSKSITNDDIVESMDWLIEQAKQVQGLNARIDNILDNAFHINGKNIELEQQNKHYIKKVRGAIGNFNQDEHQEGMSILQSLLKGDIHDK